MFKKILVFFLCLAMLPCPGQVEVSSSFFDQTQAISQEILSLQLRNASCSSAEEWIEKKLPNQIGGTAEWYVLALSQGGTWDFSAYIQSLRSYLATETVRSANTRLKYALTFLAAGKNDPYVDTVMEDAPGKQGIVSYIYGLHLMNNGCTSTISSIEETIDTLLSRQLEDGGWAITGAVSDTDVTAMALQAIAPYKEKNEKISAAIDRAVLRLSALQQPDGGFGSFGTPNPESAAQVLIALSALEIDAFTDERFIKNGKTILDGIKAYRMEDGSYSHVSGGASNSMATVQVFCAMIAYQRMRDGKGNLMVLDRLPDANQEEALDAPSSLGYKPVVSLILAGLFLICCLLLMLLKKRHWKNFLFLFLVFSLFIAALWLTNFQSAEEYYHQKLPVKDNTVGQVTVTIRCDTAAEKETASYIPKDGVILPDTALTIAPGDTPFTLLTEAARAFGIHVESSGAPGMRYVSGINYLYEFALGDLSGWIYFVNGESPSVSSDQYTLKDGDRVEWLYSCELGNDLK